MFQSEVRFPVVVVIAEDPAADQVYPIWRAPAACQAKTACATAVDDVAASTANYFGITLQNGGSAGTATTAMSNEIGGTAGWTALTPKDFTLVSTAVDLAAGDIVTLDYDETGTGTFKALTVQLDIVYGT